MARRADINEFLSSQHLAVVGVSRSGRKFGNAAYRELKAQGYKLTPVHPTADRVEGDPAAHSLAELSEPADGILIVVPPAQTERVVQEAADAGIRRVWMQQGSESEEAIRFCAEHGMSVVARECILMYAEPAAFFHRAHRWVNQVIGRAPTV
jgi:predicted CoA-binding protein